MSDKITKNDQVLGIFGRNEFQAAINEIAVCAGLFKKDKLGTDVTASNGLVAPLAAAAMGVRVKDISGISKGIQIGNKKLTNKFIKFNGSDQVLNIAVADAAFSRIDLVVATSKKISREDDDKDDDGVLINPPGTIVEELVSSKEKVAIGIKTGVASASPVAPIADESMGEIPLAHILVSPATSSITSAEIQDIRKFLIPTCEQFENLTDNIAANQTQINQLRTDFSALQATVSSQHQVVQQQILDLQATDASFATEVAGVQADLAAIQISITSLAADTSANTGSIIQNNVAIADIVGRLSASGDIGGKIQQNMADLTSLDMRLSALATSSATADAALSAAVTAVQSDIAALLASLVQAQTDIVSNSNLITQNFNDQGALIADNSAAIITLQSAPSGGDVTAAEHLVLQNRVTDLENTVGAGGVLSETVVNAAFSSAFIDLAASSFDISSAGTFTLPIAGNATPLFADDFESGVLSGTKWTGISNVSVVTDASLSNKVMRFNPSGSNFSAFGSSVISRPPSVMPTAGKIQFDWNFTPEQVTGNAKSLLFIGLAGGLGGPGSLSFGFQRNPLADSSQDRFGVQIGGIGVAPAANTITLSGGVGQVSVQVSLEGTFNAANNSSTLDLFADGQKLNSTPIVKNGNMFLRTQFLPFTSQNIAAGFNFFDVDNYKVVSGLGASTTFAASGQLVTQVGSLASAMNTVKALANATTVLPAGTSISFEVSLDNQVNFLPITAGTELVLAGTIFDPATSGFVGNDNVDLRITLGTTDIAQTPEISNIVVSTTGTDLVALKTSIVSNKAKINEILDGIDGSTDFATFKAAIAAIINL